MGKKKVIFIVIIIVLIAGGLFWYVNRNKLSISSQSKEFISNERSVDPNWQETVFSKNLRLKHPADYRAQEKDRDGRKILILEKEGKNWKMALFKKADFKDSVPTWLFPQFDDSAKEYLPLDYTEALPVGGEEGYMVWLYYDKIDGEGKSELYKIFETIRYN